MRTIKTLVCVAALATGLATAMAQSNVYSLNVVGYYNVTVDPGKMFMIANQLNTTNNQIQYVLGGVPDGTQLFKYIGGAYQSSTFVGFLGGWDQPTWTLNLGETALISDPGAGQTITFVGEVAQGALTVEGGLPAGTKVFRSSMVPQQGTPADFAVPAEDGDQIFVYNNGYATDTYVGFLGGWGENAGAGPTIKVGQGFAYVKTATGTSTVWTRNFTVQ